MNIGIICHPAFPIPPAKYGGVQRGVNDLALGLAEKGHSVFLFTPKNSTIRHKNIHLISVCARGTAEDDSIKEKVVKKKIKNLLLKNLHNIDVINLRWESREMLDICKKLNKPLLVSISCNLSKKEQNILDDKETLFTSHTKTHKDNLRYIKNVSVSNYGISSSCISKQENNKRLLLLPERFCISIAGINKQKGQKSIIEIASKIDIPLVIAGSADSRHESKEYFEKQIKPKLNSTNIIYLGEVNESEKNELFRRAEFSIVASGLEDQSMQEPYGRVMPESLMNGCPVLGFTGGGSIVELVIHKKNGYLYNDTSDAVANYHILSSFNRNEISEKAIEELSDKKFINTIEKLLVNLNKT